MGEVIVVGSINIDMVMTTERLPKIGETILGGDMNYFMGGKGANQAVASARMDLPVKMFGSVGDDSFGEKALKHLRGEGVNTSSIQVEKNIFTGLATIFSIDQDNSIVVLPGANMLLKIDQDLKKQVNEKDTVLAQLEIPLDSVQRAFEIAREQKAQTILNPAPYDSGFLEFIDLIDFITPNETEFASMIGKEITQENIETEMIKWARKYATTLIVTRGSAGVSFVEDGKVQTIAAHKIDVQDTTGAGDTFNGILASLLVKGFTLKDAVKCANYGAAISTTKVGAQSGMPAYNELFNNQR